jgi:hypothetical protein
MEALAAAAISLTGNVRRGERGGVCQAGWDRRVRRCNGRGSSTALSDDSPGLRSRGNGEWES